MATRGVIWQKNTATVWKPVQNLYYKDSGTWIPVKNSWVKIDGTWRQIYPTPFAVGTASPSSLNFTVYRNTKTSYQTVTITNTGSSTLKITGLRTITDGYFSFDITPAWLALSTTPKSLAVGQSASFDVAINGGLVLGISSGTIILETEIGALGSSISLIPVTLQTFTPFAEVSYPSLKPIVVRYDQDISNSDTTYSIIIKNTGNGDLRLTEVSSDAYRFEPYSPVISGGKSQTITFKIEPRYLYTGTVFNAGTYNPTINITAIDVTNNETRNLDLNTTLNVVPHGTISFTSGIGTWTVPEGVIDPVQISVISNPGGSGASGAPDFTSTTTFGSIKTITERGGAGGPGRSFAANIKVSPQQIFQVYIGSAGTNGKAELNYNAPGGTNTLNLGNGGPGGPTGGNIQNTSYPPGGGGGGAAATVVYIKNNTGTVTLGNLIVGGGGGGGGGGNRLRGASGGSFDGAETSSISKDGGAGVLVGSTIFRWAGGGGGGGGSFAANAGGGGRGGNSQHITSSAFSDLLGSTVTYAEGGWAGASSYVDTGAALIDVSLNGSAPNGATANVTIKW